MTDPDGPGWQQQEECERQRWEQEAMWLAADPAYNQWLDMLDAQEGPEQEER